MRFAKLFLVVGLLGLVRVARADSTAEQAAAAELLFTEALTLMEQRRFPEACAKLELSLRLDAGTGTRMNLALCYEETGRLASAWSQFRLVIGEARTAGRADRVKSAQEHADAIAPRLSYLDVSLAPPARVSGVRVSVDGVPRDDRLLGVPLPVDPGEHTVEVAAPGKRPFRSVASVPAKPGRVTVTVERLEDAPAQTSPPKHAPPPPPAAAPRARDEERTSGSRAVGWLGVGVGAAAVGVGAVFGVLAVNENDRSLECGARPGCAVDDAYARANRYAWVANVTIPVGVVALGVGGYLLLTSRSPGKGAVVRVAPGVAVRGASVGLEGAW